VKAFKGGAEYLWCNFDQVHLTAIYAECAAIEEQLQKDIKTSGNNVGGKSHLLNNGGVSFTDLEDIPATPEEQQRFDKKYAELCRRNDEYNKERLKQKQLK
jgi:hypothetical protein